MKSNLSVEEKFVVVTNNAISEYGFFASLLLHLEVVKDNSVGTMATDGKHLFYNEKFVQKMDIGELAFVIMHEVMHCALGHLWRRNDRNPMLWNIATDFAVNDLLSDVAEACLENTKKKLRSSIMNNSYKAFELVRPKNCLYDTTYHNMSAEDIYDTIKKNAKQNGSSNSNGKSKKKSDENNGSGSSGSNANSSSVNIKGKNIVEPQNHSKWDETEKMSEKEKAKQAMDWENKLLAANEQLKAQGIVSLGMERIITNIVHPQKNWRMLLQEFIQEETNDYSLVPPDKRYDGDFFMYDFNDKTEVVRDILFFVDTSCSMGEKEVNLCYSEIQGAINQFNKNLHGTLLFFDSEVQKQYYDFDDTNGDISKLSPFGGGGTSYKCVFDFVNNNRDKFPDINGIIILTDGYCDYPKESIAKDIPVLWVYTTQENNPPFGRKTTLKIEEK